MVDKFRHSLLIIRFRLKLLKDEIRKPYFINLKKFLYEQGVKGPNDNAPNLKVYPAREFTVCDDQL